MQEYNICYSLDSKYTEQFCVSAVSILKNADVDDNINFYILDGGLTKQDKANVELLKNIKNFNVEYLSINEDDFKNCPMLKDLNAEHKDYHVTLPTYFRFKLPQLLPKLDKVLYLDCDVIIKTSLKEFYSVSLKNKAAVMIEDVETKREAKRLGLKQYFNAGVMLINLDFWRKNDVETKLFDFAKENKKKILWQDQDVINCVLSGQIKAVSNKWNYQYFLYDNVNDNDLANCSVLHLAGRFKPWLMPFEHFVYDFYYYYLALTPYKNRLIAYKQASSGRYLKNDIGGSETNILHKATSEDVHKIYDEISKNYEYTNELRETSKNETAQVQNNVFAKIEETKAELNSNIVQKAEEIANTQTAQTDEKISKVYEEITKNYEYTNELNEASKNEKVELENRVDEKITQAVLSSTAQTDEKISKVYEEISKNYEYTNDIRDNLVSNFDNAKQNLYDEIYSKENILNEKMVVVERNFLNEIDTISQTIKKEIVTLYDKIAFNDETLKSDFNELKRVFLEQLNRQFEFITSDTEAKIAKVYDEITKNYEYTNGLNETSKKEIEQVKNNVFAKIEETKAELNSNVAQKAEEKANTLIAQTDEKISKVYDEISKNYDYTNEIRDEISVQTDEKIGRIYDEISKNYDYTNKLKDELSAQANLKIEEINKEISENYNYTNSIKENLENKLKTAQSNIYSYIDHSEEVSANNTAEKIDGLETKLNEKISTRESEQNRKNDLKISEVYSYTNSELTKVFKQVNENSSNLEHKIELKSYDAYKWFEENHNEINQIKNRLISTPEFSNIKELETQFEQKLQSLDEQHQRQVAQLNSDFEEKLNAQRIKYENKLMTMENQISTLEAKYLESQKGFFVKMIEKCKKR